MSSNIKQIYREIAKLDIGSVKARDLSNVKLTARQLPVRVLMPQTAGTSSYFGMGKSPVMNTTWTIRDLCLWVEVSQGKGIEQYAEGMLDYITLYIDELKTNRSLVAGSCIITAEFQMKTVNFNEQATYYAVDTILTVEEKL